MSDHKDSHLQYHTLTPDGDDQHDYPLTPPPYSPFPDHNSYMPNPCNPSTIPPNPPNVAIAGQHVYQQPMPVFPPMTANADAFQSNYGTIVQTVPQTIIFIGSCPACRVGVLEEDFTFLGLLLAILCFPIGILCCFALRQRRCPNCGTTFE
ncbi:unnamed protein product [Oppiella nova]|uniref:Membrane protein BRI3 n=1 Tax=Oppiella nova TaxID=334625 RepID=A0A7R9MQ04_9ACAR|nr:unnamed protein product [Oppiella nova]CAG2181477.1 unnamed protein product [Oppiella nova]